MAEKSKEPSPIGAILGLLVIVLIIIGGLVLLNEIENDPSTDGSPTPIPTPSESRISFVLENIATLDEGVYAVWARDEGGVVLLGTVNANTAGKFESVGDTVIEDGELVVQHDLSTATEIFISAEDSASITTPSRTVVLSADIEEGIGALLSPLIEATEFTGEYVLATPTDGPNTNETSGVWFLHRNEDGSESVGMILPTLPEGWIYFAEIRYQNVPLFIGTFEEATGADSFSGYSGEDPAPEFPGEDFLNNSPSAQVTFPANLIDGTTDIYIYIASKDFNTVPVNGLTVYTPVLVHTVLTGTVPVDGAPLNNYPLTPQVPTYPSGIVVIR